MKVDRSVEHLRTTHRKNIPRTAGKNMSRSIFGTIMLEEIVSNLMLTVLFKEEKR